MLNRRFLVFIFLGAIVLVIDMMTPRGVGLWAVYIILFFLYLRKVDSLYFRPVAVLYILFSILGYSLSPTGTFYYVTEMNRAASFIIILLAVFLTARERSIRKINSEILDRISDSFVALDHDFRITYYNKVAANKADNEKELTGKKFFSVFPALKDSPFEKALREAMDSQKSAKIINSDIATGIPYEVHIYPSRDGLSVYSRDIAELASKENQLQKTLAQKEMLIKEVHHRVKNNFQLISSIIRLSTFHFRNDDINKMVKDIESRIRVLSLIHEQLYRGSGGNVDMRLYINNMLEQLSGISNYSSAKISFKTEIEPIQLNIDSAISVGLIINELFSNSTKHAFNNKDEGLIEIKMRYDNTEKNRINLIYRDNGSGLKKMDPENSESMGLTIVKTVIEQSEGYMDLQSDSNGVLYNIKFTVN